MQKELFEEFKGTNVIISIKPNDMALKGIIDAVFDDCIEFRTPEETSYMTFDKITSIRPDLSEVKF